MTINRIVYATCAALVGIAAWVRHCNNQAVLNHAGPEED